MTNADKMMAKIKCNVSNKEFLQDEYGSDFKIEIDSCM